MDLRDIKEFILDGLKYISLIVGLLFIFMYVVSLQQVVGDSMNPTLKDGDFILLNKVHFKFNEIKRNDIVSVKYDNTKYLIKRVIGLPGEVINYKDNILYINDKTYKETLSETIITKDFNFNEITSLKEETKNIDKIPEDMYLVLGDNRNNSLDSREIGLIKKEDIIGRPTLRVMPISDFGLIK